MFKRDTFIAHQDVSHEWLEQRTTSLNKKRLRILCLPNDYVSLFMKIDKIT